MKSGWAFILCILVGIAASAQYNGGSGDGFQLTVSANQNPLPNIYGGGNNDGFSIIVTLNQNTLPNIYTGGNNDGFSLTAITGQNTLPNIYTGGADDGLDMATVAAQNPLPGIYLGGNNDGFQQVSIINQNSFVIIYSGGNNDGFTSNTLFNQNPLCTGDSAKWNGSVSIAWENPGNWDCGVLPNINSNVIIRSGLARYPTVSFSFEIKSLYLQPGASVTVSPGVNFKLNGQ